MDLGYQIVEEDSIDPCGTPYVDQRICDDRMLSQRRDIMKRMRELYEKRAEMIPSYNTNFKLACDETMIDGRMIDGGLVGKAIS